MNARAGAVPGAVKAPARPLVNEWTVVGALMFLSLGAVVLFRPGLVRFQPLTPAEFVGILTPLVLVAAFIERTVEVFLTPWRAERARKLEHDLQRAQARAADPENSLEVRQQAAEAAIELQDGLIGYKARSQRIAFLIAWLMGVFVAALGVRVLQMFVHAEEFEKLALGQRGTFHLYDVILTGAVIGGGADGIHKVVSVVLDFMERTSKRIKESA